MENAIRIGIVGYGNLGRGVEAAIAQNPDMRLVGLFTRRDPAGVKPLSGVPVYGMSELERFRSEVDVMILCGGSKDDLPQQGPQLAAMFTTVDSFDNHSAIPEYFAAVDAAAKAGKTIGMLSVGWDPGMFSLNRLYAEAILPEGATYTFWGKGLSQGHSDAIRRVPGVKGGVQYTLPVQEAMDQVRSGSNPTLSTREKHTRECFVVLEEGADAAAVKAAIVSMPAYFADYDTTVNFISEEELRQNHNTMPHGGFVIRSGQTNQGASKQVMEFSLKLDSNPEYTASVLVAYARAAHRLQQQGQSGAKTVFDVAPGLLSPRSAADLRKDLL
ncbi:diaminopimelate dehydrogenase [Pusillimonas sp. CC-YST705]|uniref:Meso-diaminopimelate D-dehydrogenase n=1 Tax=Mesopusillimonas faecipullorum TaxID=2755040 RepID=A0ABS8CDF8_9BURK|nr:diaminopimelate dehydrogenase [Mesopusillimonas faecipullorum]MCB5364061.1 diaminopimelate dehydrogenase [Mesopusillimonas faecipullorum]